MNKIVAVPVATALPTAFPVQPIPDRSVADHTLLELVERFLVLLPPYRAAEERWNELWEEFQERKPARGRVLGWRMTDPVQYSLEKLEGGKCRLWCDPYDIEELRTVRQYSWHLDEKNTAEFEALPREEQLYHLGAPHPRVQHLFSKRPDRRQQNRINKLVAALDEHNARVEALKEKLGLKAAEQLWDDLAGPILGLAERIETIEPQTMPGIQAKARMLLAWYRPEPDELPHDMHALALQIIKGLTSDRLAA